MAVMGGMRAFWGPLVGAALFVLLQDYISSMTTNWMLFVGLIFVLVVLFFPRGLLGMLRKKRRMSDAPKLEVATSARVRQPEGRRRRVDAGRARASCARSSGRTAPARPRSST